MSGKIEVGSRVLVERFFGGHYEGTVIDRTDDDCWGMVYKIRGPLGTSWVNYLWVKKLVAYGDAA